MIAIFLLIGNAAYSQNTEIYFSDRKTNKPIKNACVFRNNAVITVSDNNGHCQIDTMFKKVYVNHNEYIDTNLVFVKKTLLNKIPLMPRVLDKFTIPDSIEKLDQIQVDEKYDAKKHLKNIFADILNEETKIDTTDVFYQYEITVNVLNGNKNKEYFTGIIKTPFYAESSFYSFDGSAYYCTVDSFRTSIADEDYQYMPINRIESILNHSVLSPNEIKYLTKHTVSCPLSISDSIVFHKKRNWNWKDKTVNHYLFFNENNLITHSSTFYSEKGLSAPGIKADLFYSFKKITFSTDYIPEQILRIRHYKLKNGTELTYTVKLEKCDKPMKSDFEFPVLFSNNKETVSRILEEHPGINTKSIQIVR